MKISYIELLGERHPLCLSLSASEELSEAFDGMENMGKALESKDLAVVARAVNTVLTILMRAGRIYVKAVGGELPPELPCRPADVLDMRDGSAIKAIFSAIQSDSSREVEVQTKNGEATQGE